MLPLNFLMRLKPMAQNENRPLKKVTIRVYEDDYLYIQDMLPHTPGNVVIREVLSGYVKKVKADVEARRAKRARGEEE